MVLQWFQLVVGTVGFIGLASLSTTSGVAATVMGPIKSALLVLAQGSGILMSMVRASALLIIPEDRPEVAEGELLDAIVLDDPHHVAEPPF